MSASSKATATWVPSASAHNAEAVVREDDNRKGSSGDRRGSAAGRATTGGHKAKDTRPSVNTHRQTILNGAKAGPALSEPAKYATRAADENARGANADLI